VSAGPGTFAYAQARLQARVGERLRARADLERAHATRDLGAVLQVLRTTAYAPRVARLAAGMDAHELERRLRDEWAASVEEVARWVPVGWQPAIRWLRWLPFLPALQKLARAGRVPGWLRTDPVLGRVVAAAPAERAQSLAGTALAPLASALQGATGDAVGAWFVHWRSSWPADATAARGLLRVAAAVARHVGDLGDLPAAVSSRESRSQLDARLLRLFRRSPGSPVAAVAWLGLDALDLLELRGAVLSRAALPQVAA
jgi:hypothetical protein